MTIKIYLADDHPVVRQGMRSLIESEPGLMIVGEADNGLEVIRNIDQLKPDIALMDIVMPGISGLEVTRQIKERAFHTRVVILSMYSDESYVMEALKAGAYGYVLKGSQPATLLKAVYEVIAGRRYLCPELTERAIQAYFQKAEENAPDDFDTLSTREREVLHLAAEGLTNYDIGDKLSISMRTVEIHRRNMMHKLGLQTQRDLIRYAIRRRILVWDE
jgi:DNA-binding NarL/FixJ family response regulator